MRWITLVTLLGIGLALAPGCKTALDETVEELEPPVVPHAPIAPEIVIAWLEAGQDEQAIREALVAQLEAGSVNAPMVSSTRDLDRLRQAGASAALIEDLQDLAALRASVEDGDEGEDVVAEEQETPTQPNVGQDTIGADDPKKDDNAPGPTDEWRPQQSGDPSPPHEKSPPPTQPPPT